MYKLIINVNNFFYIFETTELECECNRTEEITIMK